MLDVQLYVKVCESSCNDDGPVEVVGLMGFVLAPRGLHVRLRVRASCPSAISKPLSVVVEPPRHTENLSGDELRSIAGQEYNCIRDLHRLS